MPHTYSTSAGRRRAATPQSEPIPGREADQAVNSAGGYSFTIGDWPRLRRFLILGSEAGTYYATAPTLTRQNATCAERCIQQDGKRAVDLVVEISDLGLAPRNTPALFVLAMALALGDEETRRHAMQAVPKVARTGTHAMQFAEFVQAFRGWGSIARKAMRGWFYAQRTKDLAFQAIKYGQRDGWALRDLMRLSHPVVHNPENLARRALFSWIASPDQLRAGGRLPISEDYHLPDSEREFASPPDQVLALLELREIVERKGEGWKLHAIALTRDHRLPREALPSELLNQPEVWACLLENMPVTAMIRNLAKMTSVGLIAPMSDAVQVVVGRLGDPERLRRARVHPYSVLLAGLAYRRGKGVRGKLEWSPVQQVVDALDDAFYLSFRVIEPTGKRHYLGLDVSGSMEGAMIGDLISARMASCAMAMVTAAVEKQHHIAAFDTKMLDCSISPKMRLADVARLTAKLWRGGGTDCAQPMIDALAKRIPADVFVIYTDNETYAGPIHPVQALQRYRQVMGIPAKLAVVGMTSTGFWIADPADAAMLDLVGFDASAPAVLAEFAGGRPPQALGEED